MPETATPRRGGLTLPGNPAAELQRMIEAESAPPPSPIASNIAMKQDSNIASNVAKSQQSNTASDDDSALAPSQQRNTASNGASGVSSETPSEVASVRPSGTARKKGSDRASDKASEVASEVAAEIARMKDTSLSQLNIRIPEAMNEWLEDEAYRRRKEKVRITKQSLVIDALALLIAQAEQAKGEAGQEG